MALKLSMAMMLLSAVVCVVLKSDKKERKNSNLLSVEHVVVGVVADEISTTISHHSQSGLPYLPFLFVSSEAISLSREGRRDGCFCDLISIKYLNHLHIY